jgi:hypothetical protein
MRRYISPSLLQGDGDPRAEDDRQQVQIGHFPPLKILSTWLMKKDNVPVLKKALSIDFITLYGAIQQTKSWREFLQVTAGKGKAPCLYDAGLMFRACLSDCRSQPSLLEDDGK